MAESAPPDAPFATRRRRLLAAMSAVLLVSTSVTGVALVEAPAAMAVNVFWADPMGFGTECSQEQPCQIEEATSKADEFGGGTVELLGDQNNPYQDVAVTLTHPDTLEAAPGATPVLNGTGSQPVITHQATLRLTGVGVSGGTDGVLGSGTSTASTITNSYVHDNSQDGLNETAGLTIVDSAIVNNGHVGVDSTARGAVLIIDSTVAGNVRIGVDALDPQVFSSSIVNNATDPILGDANLFVSSATLAGSIIAGGKRGCTGAPTDLGGNISDDSTCRLSSASSVPSSPNLDASLQPLDFNGGTPTIRLAQGSPAIGLVPGDVAGNGSALCSRTDQRGQARPSTACDAGAYQSGDPLSVTVTAPSASITYGDSVPDFVPTIGTSLWLASWPSCDLGVYDDLLLSAGTYPVTCSGAQAGTDVIFDYVSGALTVAKAPMTITASSAFVVQGGTVPTITPSYDQRAFQWGDTSAVIDTPPTCSTTATPTSALGEYPSSCSGASDDNYDFTYVNGSVNVVDETSPIASIDSGPSGTVNTKTVTFAFSSNEAGSTFVCLLDGPGSQGFQTCTSPTTYTVPVDSQYTFAVRAFDPSRNGSELVSQSFTVDTRAPNTAITSAPSGVTAQTSPSFTFQSDENGSTFQCELDGPGTATGTLLACGSPETYSGLSDGDYVFSVVATDKAGNVDPTPATQAFTVSASPPDTTIDSGPSGPTNSADAVFDFSASEPGSTFQCELDGPGLTTGSASACNSPQTYSGLVDGSYTLAVVATSAAGTPDPTPATRSFTVDTAAPTINVAAPIEGASFTEGAIVTGQYACLDAGGSGVATCVGSVASGSAIDTSAPGPHTFAVTAIDQAGNTAMTTISYVVLAPQSISWAEQGPYLYGQTPIALSASASSGLPISYALLSGPCSVSGSMLTVTGVGTCTVTASQPGNSQYAAAAPVSQSIVVNRAPTKLLAAAARVTLFSVTYSATLTSGVTGQGLTGQTVTFGGAPTPGCSATTNSSGVATCSVSGIFLILGKLKYTATYNGSSLYLPTTSG